MPKSSTDQLRDNLNEIEDIKEDIRESIANKGQNIDINTPFAEYSNLISNITTSENLDTVLNAQTQKLEELESALAGKTGDISYININAALSDSYTYTIISSSYITSLPYWNFTDCNRDIVLSNSFAGCSNLVDIPNYNFSKVIELPYTFANCYRLNSIPDFNLVNVHNMKCTFMNCFNLINVPNFYISNLFYMESCFYGCSNLVNIQNISNWNLHNLVSMNGCFINCRKLVNLSAINLDVPNLRWLVNPFSNCVNLTDAPMFYNAYSLNSISGIFGSCTNLVNVPEYAVTSNLSDMYFSFYGCKNLSDASIQNIINMCLNSGVPTSKRNLHTSNVESPLRDTNIANTRYQNRWSELTAAGWSY